MKCFRYVPYDYSRNGNCTQSISNEEIRFMAL